MGGRLNKHIFFSFQVEFKDRCHRLMIEAYFKSVSENLVGLDFEENDITDILYEIMDNNPLRIEYEISINDESRVRNKYIEKKKGFAAKRPRIDLRFIRHWSGVEHKYYIEAKNLKLTNSTLKRYITTGIDHFLSEGKYYSCDGCLVGYVLEGKTNDCIIGINKLLQKDERDSEQLIIRPILHSVDNCISSHQDRNILHLFLNYSVQ